MAKIGDIKQYQGPFDNSIMTFDFPIVLGVSISQKDFMLAGSQDGDSGVQIKINGQSNTIRIGRTFIYQTQEQYGINSVQFPEGAPASTLLTIVNCAARPETDSD